jgi:hypothetical protein
MRTRVLTSTNVRHRGSQLRWLVLLSVVQCQVYDSGLLPPRASATQTLGQAAGARAQATSAAGREAVGGIVDGNVPRPMNVPDAFNTRCGDGIISGVEKCDTAIPQSEAGSCPTLCPPLAACAPRALNGTACQSECVLIEPSCVDADGCCPASCKPATDSDCSGGCGDGVIDSERGETCEAGVRRCEQDDSECTDQDPCTVDHLVGSPTNCNSVCTHILTTERIAGDQCCPAGANNTLDPDCAPVCGNHIREVGEDCDGEPDCHPDCTSDSQTAQKECLARFGDDECKRCACMHCTESVVTCRASGLPSQNQLCGAVLDCTQRTGCEGSACYCGDPAPPCLPEGPCSAEIAAATGTYDPFVIGAQSSDPNYVLGLESLDDVWCVIK